MTGTVLADEIATKLLKRLETTQFSEIENRDISLQHEAELLVNGFMESISERLRIMSSAAIKSSLEELRSRNSPISPFAASLCRSYMSFSENPWPTHDVVSQAAQKQWEQVVADIAGRWLHDWSISSQYQVSSSSALAVRLLHAHRKVGEGACRLERYLEQDKDVLDLTTGPTRITFGLGDPHSGLQTVAKVVFPDRSLIYRPHCSANGEVLSKICKLLSAPRPPRVWDLGDHSWSEFIEPTEGVTDADEFYAGVGAWTALGFLLNGADFHNENFIVEGNTPRLIDLETLFRPQMKRVDSHNGMRWAESVLAVGTLPFKIGKGPDSIEVGLVRGRPHPGGRHPFPAPIVRTMDDGTRRFEMQDSVPSDPSNTVFLEEEPEDLQRVTRQIKEAFAKTLRNAEKSRDTIVQLILPLRRAIRCRVVVTPTYRYAQVQATAAHPVIADDPYLFALACAQIRLWGDQALWKSEWAQLMNDDIPAFSVAMDSYDVGFLDGTPLLDIPNVQIVSVNAVDNFLDKMAALDRLENLIEEQNYWIEASFIGRYRENRIKTAAGQLPDVSLVDMVTDIADMIKLRAGDNSNAHFGTDFLTASVGEEFDRNWQVFPSNDDFYGGTAGTLYFLANYYRSFPDREVGALLQHAVSSFQKAVEGNPRGDKRVGGLGTGDIGLLISAVSCGEAIRWQCGSREIFLDASNAALDNLIKQLRENCVENRDEINLDAINGLASQLRAFVEIADMLPELQERLVIFSELVNAATESWLLKYRDVLDDGGFAHSTAGILDSYVASSLLCGKEVSSALVGCQVQAIVAAAITDGDPALGWCHGIAGLGALSLTLLSCNETNDFGRSLIDALRPYLLADVSHLGMSVCHGYLGLVEVLCRLGKLLKDSAMLVHVANILEKVLVADLYGAGLTKEHYSTSLYCGLAGVGQVILACCGFRVAAVLSPWQFSEIGGANFS